MPTRQDGVDNRDKVYCWPKLQYHRDVAPLTNDGHGVNYYTDMNDDIFQGKRKEDENLNLNKFFFLMSSDEIVLFTPSSLDIPSATFVL